MRTITKYTTIIIAAFLFPFSYSNAQLTIYENGIFSDSIKSVQCYTQDSVLFFPVIKLKSTQQVTVSFDLLGSSAPFLRYRIVHCSAEWSKSNLMPIEYIVGFPDGECESSPAGQTKQDYTHYWCSFPNEDSKLTISGNYILEVYEEETENILLRRRFFVTENSIDIKPKVSQAMLVERKDSYQEVDVILDTKNLPIIDPFNDIKLVILQNGDWNTACDKLQPRFVNQNILDYDYEEGNLFEGGNENRQFIFKEFVDNAFEIEDIIQTPSRNEIILKPEIDKEFKRYSKRGDLNGKFFIYRSYSEYPNTEADYALVTFTLLHDMPVLDGYVCVYGQLTDWKCDSSKQLTYNYDTHRYSGQLYLKQGYYDYKFAVVRQFDNTIDTEYFEGSHFETENDYQILVYFKDKTAGYHRLVAYQLANSEDIYKNHGH